MLESSQRIDHLAEMAKSRLPMLSEPGQPGQLPPAIYDANIFVQIYALLIKTIIYTQPWTMIKLLQKIIIAASLSLIIGGVFWNVTEDKNLFLRDKIGFYYTSLGVLFWPLALIGISEVTSARPSIERDIKDGLYGRFIHIIIEVIIMAIKIIIIILFFYY